jgi:RHS repeat-associated protein
MCTFPCRIYCETHNPSRWHECFFVHCFLFGATFCSFGLSDSFRLIYSIFEASIMASSSSHLRWLHLVLIACLSVTLLPPPQPAFAQSYGSVVRFEDSSTALATTGTWSSTAVARMSGGTVRQSKTANSTISLTFTGSWVSIGFRTLTNAGKVAVAIDGVTREVVDTYSRFDGTLTRFYPDLDTGTHTITLTVLGQRHLFSSDNWVLLDYIDVWDGEPLSQGTFEHDHLRVYRSTDWITQANSSASNGSYLRDGNNLWFPFTGTSVSIDAIAESGGGTIQIFIDGVSQGFFSLSHPTLLTRRFSFAGLSDGIHIVQIQAYRGRATIDAISTPGTGPFIMPPDRSGVSRYEEDDPALRYDGAPLTLAATKWNTFSNNRASSGYALSTDPVGSTITLTFTGPWVHVGLLTSTNGGVVEVSIDGVSRGSIDTYSRYEDVRSISYADLGSGEHTLSLTVLARPTGTLGGTRLHLDYIDVWDGTTMAAGTFEHTDTRVIRSGGWVLQNSPIASEGSYLRDGLNIWVPFTGDSVTLQAIADPNGGEADLIIDGVRRGAISFAHPTTSTRSWTFDNLGPGGHVLQIRAYRGNTRFDHVSTPGIGPAHTWPIPTGVVRYEEDHPALRYNGLPLTATSSAWNSFSNNRLSGRHGVWTGTANASASLTVTGSWLHVGLIGSTNGGSVDVQIDGVSQGIIDTYRPSEQTFSIVYPDLGPGEHTITLTLLGTPSGRRLHLDYIDVWDGTAMPDGTFEHDSERTFQSGNWVYVTEPQASAGSSIRSGHSAWFPFVGESVTYQSWSHGGTVELRIDGQTVETVNLQQSVAGLQAWTLSNLGDGPHVLEVRSISGTAGFDHTVTPGRAHGDAPTGLRTLAVTDTSITLAWDAATAAAGIAGYDVSVGDVLVGTTVGSALTIPNLLAGTSYALTVRARDTQGALSPASTPLIVSTTGADQGVTLVATLSPSSATTDERVVDLVVEARDANGNLVPGYRGAIEISPSAATVGLPQNSGADYTFTANDGGRRVFSDFAFLTGGSQTVTVTDRNTPSLTATTNTVAIQAIRFVVTVSPTTVYAGDPTTTVTVEVQDDAGNVVPGYRGTVTFSSTSSFSGLPPGGLGGARYTFTEADGGRHTWTGVTLNTGGSHTVTVRDGIRTGTSPLFTVQPVSLAINVNPTSVFAGEPVIEVTVEAQDVNGDPVPGYRGTVAFSSTSSFSGLPPGGLGGARYTFTEADAGRRTWTGVTLHTAGTQTISVGDGTRTATSSPITVQTVTLAVLVSPTSVYAGEPVIDVTVEARDSNGELVPGYRGVVTFTSTSTFSGLPVGGLGGNPYGFTAADAGRRTWTDVTLNTAGTQTISVSDGTRTATSLPITVQAVTLALLVSPTSVFAGEPIIDVTVEARDSSGELVPGYRGVVTFTSTSAFSGLPVGGLGGNPYGFTAADAGRRTWTGVTLHTAGNQTITVTDGTRTATSVPITVQAVSLNITVSSTSILVCDPNLEVTVEARDAQGHVVPGYRGQVTFTSTGALSGLPVGGLGGNPYTFTAEDAGSRTWTGVTVFTAGMHTFTVSDGFRQATSTPITIGDVQLRATLTGAPVYLKVPSLTLTIEAVTANGDLVPSYRCAVDLNASAPVHNLPQSTFNSTPDYTFTAEDGGRKVFTQLAFLELGAHTIQVVDRGNPNRQATTESVEVGMPLAAEPVPPAPVPPVIIPPLLLPPAPTFAYGWMEPYLAVVPQEGWNYWKGYPPQKVVASPGAIPIVSGVAQRMPGEWWPTSFYPCVALGWEDPLTDLRGSGSGLSVGNLVYDGLNFIKLSIYECGGWSSYANNGAPVAFGPWFPNADTIDELMAPAGAEGSGVNIQGAGNATGLVTAAVQSPEGDTCQSPAEGSALGNPIDIRSGFKVQHERDIGVATGCDGVALSFERTYRANRPAGGALGPGWVHTFESHILDNDGVVLVQMPRGEHLMFRDVGGTIYAARPGSQHTLMKRAEGGWALIYRSQRVDVFDAAGRLIAIQDPNGNQLWLTYEAYDRTTVSAGTYQGTRLARVDAPGGRYLWFGYDYYLPQRLTSVTDHTGRSVQFGYDDVTHERPGQLVAVTDPLGHTATYAYAENSWLLQTKTNARGEVEFENTFDSSGRVVQQVNSLGQELTLSYATVPDTNGLLAGTDLSPYLLQRTITDQTGAQVMYTFGADGLLRSMTDPAGATTTYRGYTATRQPTEIEDGLGRVTTYVYNDQGLPTRITNPLSQTTELAYDAWGRPTIITDTLARAYTFTYTGPNLTQMTDPLGQTVVMTYTTESGWQGLLRAVANQEGQVTTFAYNAAGDLTRVFDALNQETTIAYDALGRPVAMTDARNHTTTMVYDALDRVTQITDALSGTMAIDYDPVGNPLRLTDQAGFTTVFTYSLGLRNRPIAIQDARGGVMTIAYGPLGRPITVTDQLGNQVGTTYDLAGRPIAVTDPLGNTTRYAYDVLGNTTVITDANGHAVTIAYDALNRPIELRNALGQALHCGYDPVGNVTVLTDTLGFTRTMAYDALNRPTTVIDQEGRATQYAYTPLGQTQVITDGNGVATRYAYDPLGRLTEVLANYRAGIPASVDTNVRTAFAYDPVGNLREVTDPRNTITTFTYDPLNRLASLTDPLNRTMQYQYDARGLLERWTKADGSAITYGYNPTGQMTSVTAPDQTIEYTYDERGRLVSMQDSSGATGISYDAASRPLTVTLSLGGSVGYGYDAVGNRTRLTYPDGRSATYTYDSANQLTSIADWSTGTTAFAYDANGRLITTTLPSGVQSLYGYDRSGLPVSIQHRNGGSILADYAYTYDATGRRIGAIEDSRVITATYDSLYRLLTQQDSSGANYAYTYDAAGNRLSAVEPGGTSTATYDVANQLLSLNGLPVQYDANGNLLSDGERSYSYDALDRLIAVTQGSTTTTFGYNGQGDRIQQTVDGLATTFTLDLASALPQVLTQQTGSATTYLLPGVGQQVNGGWQYMHGDVLGSVRLLTDPSGQILSSMRYTPFGEVEATSGPNSVFGFTGEPSDPSGDLLYLRARFYHPALGRFLTPDSIIPDPLNGQAWNQYAYVYNDPANLVDPSGHHPVLLRLTALGLGVMLTVVIVEAWGNATPERSDWWNSTPTCQCTPASPPTIPGVLPGLAPGLAFGVGTAMGLGQDLIQELVPSQGSRISQQRIDYLQEISWKYDAQWARDELRTLRNSGQIRVSVRPNWGISEGVRGSTGFLHLKLGGILGISAVLDMFFQSLSDQGLCLSPRQQFYRVLWAGGLSLAAGALGLGVGAAALGVGATAGVAAAFGVVSSFFGSLFNEMVIKPAIWDGFEL